MTAAAGRNLLCAALRYAARGVPVFPLAPGRKVPAIPSAHHKGDPAHGRCQGECGREGHGFHDAATDANRIRAWWAQWPNANIGAPTGVVFDVLDIDGTTGAATLRALEAKHGPLPETVYVQTGGGGLHGYFASDAHVRCSAGRLGLGLDVRGRGGYVVLPPSVHESGRRYACGPCAPLAPWPAWLLALIAPPQSERPKLQVPVRIRDDGSGTRYGLAVLRRACAVVAAACEGTRHDVFRRRARTVCGFVAGGELAEDLARDCLLAAAAECGLPHGEAERTWTWALASGAAEPLAAPERGRQ